MGTLEVKSLSRSINGKSIFHNLSFTVPSGHTLLVMGPSGAGKSLLLRSIAYLDGTQSGVIHLNGLPPDELTIPIWRARVMYVTQSRVNFKGTPTQLFQQAVSFASQRHRPHSDLLALVQKMGMEPTVLRQQWSELSGGQAQRVALALAIALQPDVLLLDEPTSACDPASTLLVEQVLRECGSTLVWVTHDPQQAGRVGGAVLQFPVGQVQQVQQHGVAEV